MRKILLVLLGLLFVSSGIAHAEEKAFNLSLLDPVQVFDNTTDVSGIRLNLLYGRNAGVKGLDLGIGVGRTDTSFSGVGLHYVGNLVKGNSRGLQLANVANVDLGDFNGVQFAGVNYIQGSSVGFQLAYANIVRANARGVKFGLFNFTKENFTGLQLGIVNIGGLKKGLQIGLININRNKKPLPFFIIANYGSGS